MKLEINFSKDSNSSNLKMISLNKQKFGKQVYSLIFYVWKSSKVLTWNVLKQRIERRSVLGSLWVQISIKTKLFKVLIRTILLKFSKTIFSHITILPLLILCSLAVTFAVNFINIFPLEKFPILKNEKFDSIISILFQGLDEWNEK